MPSDSVLLALAGAAIRISLDGVFWVTGFTLVTLAIVGLMLPVTRRLGMTPA